MTDKPPGKPTQEQNGHRLLRDRQLTAIECAQVRNTRDMVKQLVLARDCRERGDSDGYAVCCARAAELADSIKREIDQLFEIYHSELLCNK
jgi:hypothetical protein